MARGKKTTASVTVPFYDYLRSFCRLNRGQIRFSYKDLTKRLLDYNDPDNSGAFFRKPQFEAFEMYVFLKEYLDNPRLSDLLEDFRANRGKFELKNSAAPGQQDLFCNIDAAAYEGTLKRLEAVRQDYANYIFALTMGVGKTILMATCIFYEFLLARKFPEDDRFCANAIVFAPDTTVLESLREIVTFDKTKVLPPEYARSLDADIKFYFLDESGVTLNTLDRSSFNVVISNTQKIILKRRHAQKTAQEKLFSPLAARYSMDDDPNADLYAEGPSLDSPENEGELSSNQRFKKLARLHQLGIYVDEAHHAFGNTLKKDLAAHEEDGKSSLRATIDELVRELKESGTKVVACYNFTGTPYIANELMPEVVYAYSLNGAIKDKYLKTAAVSRFNRVRSLEFVRGTIGDFLREHGERRYEGMLPKMAFFAATIEELEESLKPDVEKVLSELGLSSSSVLVNVGDEKYTSQDDIREFRGLDSPESNKQFILLVGKGKEGWNCRSLFSVALFREPKSKIFVLQSTMRCMRSITREQQRAHIFLSAENYEILDAELKANYHLSVEEFTEDPNKERETRHVFPTKPPVYVEVSERKTLFDLSEKEPNPDFSLGLDELDPERYKITETTVGIEGIGKDGVTMDRTELRADIEYTPLTLVAEISRYLNRGPVGVEDLLARTKEGIDGILAWVNRANRILYEVVIPRLFGALYSVTEYLGPEVKVRKILAKDPPDPTEGYTIHVKPDLFAEEQEAAFLPFTDKSFHLTGYGFDSRPELEFFKANLPVKDVQKIWFTGMLTAGQTDFVVHYIDPDSKALRSYYPDFLIEQADGSYLIIEIKADYMIGDPTIVAKEEYAERFASANRMRYVLIPASEANQTIGSYLSHTARPLAGSLGLG